MNKTAEEKILKLVTRINRRAHKKGATEKLEPYQGLQRWENTIFCAICGRYIKLQNASLDHVVPLTNGGSNAIWNILIVHRWCNNQKGEQNLISARSEMLRAYPLEESGNMLRDTGVLDVLVHAVDFSVERSALPSNFADMRHDGQVKIVEEISANNAERGYGLFSELPRIQCEFVENRSKVICIAKFYFSGMWCTKQLFQKWDRRMKEHMSGSVNLIIDSESIMSESGQTETDYVKSVYLYWMLSNTQSLSVEIISAWAQKILEMKLGLIWADYHEVIHQSGLAEK